jgi:hypothetical protein
MKPADSGDLFSAPTEKKASPATAPPTPPQTPPATAPSSSDDLFGGPAKPETKSATPASTPKPADKTAAPETKPADKSAAPANDKSKPDEKKKEEKKDDLFGSAPSILREAGGLASEELREWTDNTGTFSCRGRMVQFNDGRVRLMKENGHTATVPLARLSTRDLEFVNRQASAQQAELGKTAQSPATLPALAN